jgi:hypothetical protein
MPNMTDQESEPSISTDEEPTPSDLEFIEQDDLKWNDEEYVPDDEEDQSSSESLPSSSEPTASQILDETIQ